MATQDRGEIPYEMEYLVNTTVRRLLIIYWKVKTKTKELGRKLKIFQRTNKAIDDNETEFLNREVWIAARDGSADRIVDLLWNVDSEKDVNEILNYHKEENGESMTPLIIAICNGHETVVDVLLLFGVDLEQKGTIDIIGNKNYAFYGVTALWCAAYWGHYNIVKVLVRNGAKVNNTAEGGAQPLMSACFENNSNNLKIVQYLVEHGADVNATRDMNFTSLMDASRKGYNDIVQYLLEKGADPEFMDSSGRTALHSAARGGHFLVSKLLVETGVTMEKDNNGLTPLIEAAMNSKTEIVEYLLTLPECSRHDRIDAIELLGTSFMFKEHPYTSKAYSYFQKAMQERYEDQDDIIPKHVVSEISVIFDTKECMSLIELAEIRDDELALKIEALAVQERILGLDHWQLHNNIMHSGIALRNMGDFNKSIELLLYGSKLKQKNDKNVNVICFPELFAKMFDGGIKIDFSSLLESFQIVVTEVKLETCRIQNGDTHFQQYYETDILACMYLVGIMLLTYTSKHEENQLYRAVRNFMNFIRQEPQFENEFNPLHMCCTNGTNDNKIDVCNIILFPNILLCQTLMACGADINARDSHHNTPLHIIAKSNISDFEIQREIIKCLIENGAHLDVHNTDDETAVDVSSSSIAEDFIKAHMKLSLKCLTARVIVNNGIEYQGTIPVSLYDFVELH